MPTVAEKDVTTAVAAAIDRGPLAMIMQHSQRSHCVMKECINWDPF